MIALKDIQPLSDFVRNAKARVARLKKDGRPLVLTVNGQAEVVVMSAEAYEKLAAALDEAETINVANGSALEALRAGEVPVDEFIGSLRPRPEMKGIPVDEAFAGLDRRTGRRRKKKAS